MADAARIKYEQICPDCRGSDFVENFSEGDLVCTNCGLVVEAHAIDERSEWRTFSDKDKDGPDPTRVGGPTNHLLSDGGLGTVIGDAVKGSANASLTHDLKRLHNRGTNPDRSLLIAFGQISRMCEGLGLVRTIKDRACELFKKVADTKGARGRGTPALCAAVIYIACRQESAPRTFKEICTVTVGATKTEVGRTYKVVVKQLEQAMGTIHAADCMRRFCSHLGLQHSDMKAAADVAEEACPRHMQRPGEQIAKPWDSRSPLSVAAAILYAVCALPKASAHPSAAAIAREVGVAEITLQAVYKELYPELGNLIPDWFATKQQIAALPVPL